MAQPALAKAFVQLFPSFDNFFADAQKQLGNIGEKLGQGVGKDMGEAVGDELGKGLKNAPIKAPSEIGKKLGEDIAKETNEQLSSEIGKGVHPAETGKQIGEELAQGIGDTISETLGEQIGKGLDDLPAVDGAGEAIGEQLAKSSISRFGGLFKSGFAKVLAGAGGAALIGKAFGAGAEAQQESAKTAAALNLSDADAKKTAAASAALFNQNYGEDAASVNDAMRTIVGTVNNAKDYTQADLVSMGKDVLNLTSTYDVGSEEVTKAIAAMQANGIIDPDSLAGSKDGINAIYNAMSQLGAKGDDVLDTFNEYSGDFKSLGLNAEQASASLVSLVKGGFYNTDTATDFLRETGIRLRGGDTGAMKAIQGLGLDPKEIQKAALEGGDAYLAALGKVGDRIKNSGINYQANAQAVFGTQSEDQFNALKKVDFNALGSGKLAEGADTENLDKKLNDYISFASVIRTLGTSFQQAAQPLLKLLKPALDWFNGFITTSPAAAGALATVMGGALVIAIVAATAALWGMVAPVLANPITYVILVAVAAIALLGLAIKWIIDHWGDITKNAKKALGAVGKWFADLGKSISDWFGDVLDGWTDFWEGVGDGMADFGKGWTGFFEGLGEDLGQWNSDTSEDWNAWLDSLGAATSTWAQDTGSSIGGWFTQLGQNIARGVQNTIAGARQLFTGAVQTGQQILSQAGAWIASILQTAVSWYQSIGTAVLGFWTGVFGFARDALNAFIAAVTGAFQGYINFITGLPGQVWAAIQGAFAAVGDFFAGLWSKVSAFVGQIVGAIQSIPLVGGALNFVGGVASTIGSALPQLADGATILPRRGGTNVTVGEAGRAESVVDTGLLNQNLAHQNRRLAGERGRAGATEDHRTMQITLQVQPGMDIRAIARQLQEHWQFESNSTTEGVWT